MTGPKPPERVVDGIPVERVRALIRLLWPAEMTPTAKRVLESVCDEYALADELSRACPSTFHGIKCAETPGEHETPGMHMTDPNRRVHATWPDGLDDEHCPPASDR